MLEIIPNWHPIFVHFTVALLTISVLLFAVGKVATSWRLEDQLAVAAYWNLWIDSLLSIVTVAAGWYAFNTVDHNDAVLPAMVEHRTWALAAFGVFTVVAVWSVVQYNAEQKPSVLFLTCAFVGLILLVGAARHGGDLVYGQGLGVKALSSKGAHTQTGDQSKAADGVASAAAAPVAEVAPAAVAPVAETASPALTAEAEVAVVAPAASVIPVEPSAAPAVEDAPAAEPVQSEVGATAPLAESAPAQ